MSHDEISDRALKRLALAVVLQAITDAQQSEPYIMREAQAWLMDAKSGGRAWLDLLGIEPPFEFEKWVKQLDEQPTE